MPLVVMLEGFVLCIVSMGIIYILVCSFACEALHTHTHIYIYLGSCHYLYAMPRFYLGRLKLFEDLYDEAEV